MTQSSSKADHPIPGVTAELNPRDLRVLDYLAEGRSTALIASALSVSGNTARSRIRRVQRRLGVTDRPSAVHAGRALGLLSAPALQGCP